MRTLCSTQPLLILLTNHCTFSVGAVTGSECLRWQELCVVGMHVEEHRLYERDAHFVRPAGEANDNRTNRQKNVAMRSLSHLKWSLLTSHQKIPFGYSPSINSIYL